MHSIYHCFWVEAPFATVYSALAKMDEPDEKDDKSMWAVGGGELMGVGAGFFFLKEPPLTFVGCVAWE